MRKKSRFNVFEVKPIPVSSEDHPESPNIALPKHEFTMGLIGIFGFILAPKGRGKTTLIINLLKFYQKYFHTIIVFSPSIKNDEKWEHAKQLELLVQNKKLQKALIDIEKKRKKQYNAVVGDPPIPGPSSFPRVVDDERNSPDDTFDGKIPESCFLDDYVEEDLREILGEQNNLINMLQEHGYSKHTANRLLIIYDDLVGSSLYNTSKNGIFKKSNTNHRWVIN